MLFDDNNEGMICVLDHQTNLWFSSPYTTAVVVPLYSINFILGTFEYPSGIEPIPIWFWVWTIFKFLVPC